jgi:hypothetical protein
MPPSGQEALRWALSEAHARRGRLRAVHAWTSPYDYQLEVYFPPDEAALRAAAQRRLDEALAEVDVGAVDVEAELIEGDPRHVLVDAARDADLLASAPTAEWPRWCWDRSARSACTTPPDPWSSCIHAPPRRERHETPVWAARFNATVRAPSTPELIVPYDLGRMDERSELGTREQRGAPSPCSGDAGLVGRGASLVACVSGSDTLGGMCSRVECPTCKRPTYAGCGRHVEQVLGDVAPDQRCDCAARKQPTRPSRRRRSWFGSRTGGRA